MAVVGLSDKTISKLDHDKMQVYNNDKLWTYLPENTTARVWLFGLPDTPTSYYECMSVAGVEVCSPPVKIRSAPIHSYG